MIAPRPQNHHGTDKTNSVQLNFSVAIPPALLDRVMQLLSRATLPNFQPVETTTPTFERQPAAPPQPQQAPQTQPPAGETVSASPAESPVGPLEAAYRANLLPRKMRTAGRKSWKDHITSVSQFDAWYRTSKQHRLPTPVLFQNPLPDDLLLEFAEHRFRVEQNSVCTITRRLTHVLMTLKSVGITAERPSPDELKQLRTRIMQELGTAANEPKDNRRIPSWQELDQAARNVSSTTYPYGVDAPYFWQGWIRYLSLYGPRSRDIVSPLTSKPGLLKSDIVWDSLCPDPDVSNALGYDLHSPHGWLTYRICKDVKSDCKRVLFPMPEWMSQWVRFFADRSTHPVRVFPSVQTKSKSLNQQSLSASWKRILTHADLDSRLVPSEGKGNKIAIRKFAANWWKLATQKATNDARLAEKMSYYILHHAEATTAAAHYLNVSAEVLPIMIELLPTFPLPGVAAA